MRTLPYDAYAQGFFVFFTLLAGEATWAGLGFLRITLANALAAASMAGMLTWFVARALRDPA